MFKACVNRKHHGSSIGLMNAKKTVKYTSQSLGNLVSFFVTPTRLAVGLEAKKSSSDDQIRPDPE